MDEGVDPGPGHIGVLLEVGGRVEAGGGGRAAESADGEVVNGGVFGFSGCRSGWEVAGRVEQAALAYEPCVVPDLQPSDQGCGEQFEQNLPAGAPGGAWLGFAWLVGHGWWDCAGWLARLHRGGVG